MLEFLDQVDKQILFAIHDIHGTVGNAIIPFFREKVFWIPFYVFLFGFLVFNFKRRGLWLILFFLITVGLGDTISSKLIKFSVRRPRPCHVDSLQEHLDMLVPCGGPYGFTSSHATNHFAIAILLIVTLGPIFPKIRIPLILWATLVGFAQVYVGVHYPFDILGGAILGALIGWGVGKIYNHRIGLQDSSFTGSELSA